jgi:hypothetical protein
METEMVSESSVIFNPPTRLIAQVDFINLSRCESFGYHWMGQAGDVCNT